MTPHVLRHTAAMELLQAGVDRTVIALWLGHESMETTQVYLDADLAMKEKALEKLTPPETKAARFKPGDELLAFLASLAAGNVAATGGMAQLIGEKEFPTLSHEGERESIHISVIGRVLLVVVFDERSSLGLVKLRSKQVSQEIAAAFAEIERESQDSLNNAPPFAEITDDEIDSLFSQT